MKKRIFIIIFGVLTIGLLMISIYFFLSSMHRYDLTLTNEVFLDSNISIDLPQEWVLFDVKSTQDHREGYGRYLIITDENFGGFPQIEIYNLPTDQNFSLDELYNQMFVWDKARIQETNTNLDIKFEDRIEYMSGQLMKYLKDNPNITNYQREICKDWVSVFDQSTYIISICELENRWEYLNKIYPDIIASFKEINEGNR